VKVRSNLKTGTFKNAASIILVYNSRIIRQTFQFILFRILSPFGFFHPLDLIINHY